MPDKHLFEYAVVRVVPRVERGEFVNAGVVLYCAKQKFLQIRYEINEPRLLSLYNDLDLSILKERFCAFECICKGAANSGPIGRLPLASRFRWLTATRSTVVQISPVHPGLCESAEQTLGRLYTQLVG